MHGGWAKRFAAALLAVLVCTATAEAVDMGERKLVPVGHTVGVKLFAKGVSLSSLHLRHFNPGKYTSFSYMFADDPKLKSANLAKLNTAAAVDMSHMFENFKKIKITGGCFENETELELFKKDTVSVVYGRNGSGKTTIAHCVGELVKPDEEKSAEYTVTSDVVIPEDKKQAVFIF